MISAMKISFMNPKSFYVPTGYTHVLSVETPGKILFISGQTSRNAKGDVIGLGDLEAQTTQVYENLAFILKEMGASFDNVVQQTIYTTRVDEIDLIRKVRDKFIHKDRAPASTLVGVTGLARKEFLIEVEMIAVLK